MKFRRAVGAIVLDKNNNIICFQRSDFPESWQEPEGGIDNNETPVEALYRELYEEINLDKNDFEIIKETKKFIPYLFVDGQKFGYDGQEKKFFLIKLNKDKNFKFDNTKEIEFSAHKIVTAEELLDKVPEFKRNMYREVLKEFEFLK